jgi:hypothetical protein
MTGGTNSKKLLVAWQALCVTSLSITKPREQTVKFVLGLGSSNGLSDEETRASINALWNDGIIRIAAYDTGDRQASHKLKPTEKLTLRDAYVPSSKEKLDAVTKPGKEGAYEDMALGVAYNDYLEFMNSSFLQKSTNFVHDHFCLNGLDVLSGDGTPAFKIYGDDSMFKKNSSKGLAHSGETAHRSRDAIISISETGDAADSMQDILKRLPEKVVLAGGASVGLDEWQTGALRTQCETSLFPEMSNFGKNQTFNKIAPGALSSSLGKISKDPAPHGNDVF